MKSKTAKKNKPRTREVAKHRSFKLSKQKLKQHAPIPGAISLFKQTFLAIWSNKKLFFGIAVINALISFVFLQGLGSSFDINELKTSFEELFGESGNEIGTAAAIFGYLVGSAGSTPGEASGSYQLSLTLVTSLAAIWAVRQVQAGEKPRLRDSFYKGMYPLIPFLLVLFVIALQLIPLLIGNLIYATVTQNSLAASVAEQVLTLLVFISLALLSGYMLVSSLFAMYISTLPDMTPLKALRSARELVLHRRLAVSIRIVALPIVGLVLAAIVFIPLIIVAAPLAQALFILATSFSLVAAHVYMYLLYRSLI